jgi:hypothetical protein
MADIQALLAGKRLLAAPLYVDDGNRNGDQRRLADN